MNALVLKVNRETLRFAIVNHPTFFCPYSKKGLDVRRSALLVFTTPEGEHASLVVDGTVLDEMEASGPYLGKPGVTVEVYDGRKLFGRSPKGQAAGYRTVINPGVPA